MTKRKNKQSLQSKLKITKAQHRNEFLGKIKFIFKTITGSDLIYSLIPEFHKDWIYNNRTPSVRVKAAEGQNISPDLVQDIAWVVSEICKDETAEIMNTGIKISVQDYLSVNTTLYLYINQIKIDENPKLQKITKAFEEFCEFYKTDTRARHSLKGTMLGLSIYNSDLSNRIIWFKETTNKNESGNYGAYFCMEMYSYIPEKINFTIDGISRPAVKIGWGFMNIGEISTKVKGSDFGNTGAFAELEMNTYIQHHALLRLTERLDCLNTGFLHFCILDSLTSMKAEKTKSGSFLLEYRIFSKRVGYLLADIINGAVIIRTFLFITNNGTPEGEKLNADTGLEKEDHKYLMIDKLSTFMTSDIRKNEKIKEIFISAGCGDLFELDEADIQNKKIKESSPAKAMMEYLGLKIKNEPPSDL